MNKTKEQLARAAAFKSALKTLDQAPKRIRAAREKYKEDTAPLKTEQARRVYSEVFRENAELDARSKRDAVIKKQVDEIRSALQIVRENRELSDSTLDVNNPKLQNALTVINTMGRDMDIPTQMSIAEQFRGDPASLRFLAGVYKKNGYYYADSVKSMTDLIPQQAIDDMAYNVNRYDYIGKWDDESDAKIYWTKGEFAKAYERYGFGKSDTDPYEDALALMKQRYSDDPDAQKATGYAIRRMRSEDMTPTEKAELFNQTADAIKSRAAERADKQIRYDAAQYKAEQHTDSIKNGSN